MNLLCFVGYHDWTWAGWAKVVGRSGFEVQECRRCGRPRIHPYYARQRLAMPDWGQTPEVESPGGRPPVKMGLRDVGGVDLLFLDPVTPETLDRVMDACRSFAGKLEQTGGDGL